MMRYLLVLCAAVAACVAQTDPPRNIILIVADDLGWSDLGCYGSELHRTPNLDGLARAGVRFTNAYANAPNCAPSRACLMTGLYTPRHGVYTVGSSARGKAEQRRLVPIENRTDLDEGFTTIAEVLGGAGYATASIGKWHLGESPTAQGFDINLGGTAMGHPKSYFSPYQNPSLEDGPEGEYLTDRLTDEAIKFVSTHMDSPFFLYLPYYTVHTPIQGRPDLVEESAARAAEDERIRPGYDAMISALDENVGRLLWTIDALGMGERTVVVFISDNGGHGPVTERGPLRGSKGMLYEGGVRVPMIVSGAGVGRVNAEEPSPVIGLDLFPTLVELAGVEFEGESDGESLVPLLGSRGGEAWSERALYWHFPAYLQGTRGEDGVWRTTPAGAVRVGDYKLIEFFEDGRAELYDLAADPGETRDLSGEVPEVAERLRTRLREWREATGAPVPTEPEPAYEPGTQR